MAVTAAALIQQKVHSIFFLCMLQSFSQGLFLWNNTVLKVIYRKNQISQSSTHFYTVSKRKLFHAVIFKYRPQPPEGHKSSPKAASWAVSSYGQRLW